MKRLLMKLTHPVGQAVLLALLALVIRRALIHFPLEDHPDEPIIASLIERAFATGRPSVDWNGFPGTFWSRPTYQFSPYTWVMMGIAWVVRASGHPLNRDGLILLARASSSVFGALAVLATFLAGHRFFRTRGAAWLSGLFLTLALLNVQDSIYARVDAFVSLVATLCLYCTALALEPGAGRGPRLASAMVAGLGVAAKYNSFPLLLLPALLPALERLVGERSTRAVLAELLLLGLCAASAFLLGTPELLRSTMPFVAGLQYEYQHYSGGHVPHRAFDGSDNNLFYWTDYLVRLGFGAIPTALCVGYGVLAVRRRTRPDLVLITYMVVAAIFALLPKVRFERNLESLLPAMALGAGAMGSEFLHRLAARAGWWAPVAIIMSVLVGLAQPLRILVHFREAIRPDASPLQASRPPAPGPSRSFMAFETPPEAQRGLKEILLYDYGDRFSAAGVDRWRRWLGPGTVRIYPSAWAIHGYPYSTVDDYHGPRRLIVLWPDAAPR